MISSESLPTESSDASYILLEKTTSNDLGTDEAPDKIAPALDPSQIPEFEHTYNEHHPSVYRIAARILNDPHTAEDITQIVFLQAYRYWNTFKGEHRGGWLHAIARNAVFGHLRQRARNEYLLFDPSSSHEDKPSIFGQSHEQTDPAEDIALRNDHTSLSRMVGKLSLPLAEALVLRYIVGLSIKETAEHLGIPSSTVRTRTFYAVRKLLESAGIDPDKKDQGEGLEVIASLLLSSEELTYENDSSHEHLALP